MLETKRLRMEPWLEDDWMQFRELAADPRVVHYISGGRPWTEEEIRRFADKQLVRFAEDGFCRWKLSLREGDGSMIGFCGMGLLDGFDAPEIGWWLKPEHWHKGFAFEAATEALRDAQERVKPPRIISVAHHENAPSIGVMRKIGLHFDRMAEYRGYPVVVYTL